MSIDHWWKTAERLEWKSCEKKLWDGHFLNGGILDYEASCGMENKDRIAESNNLELVLRVVNYNNQMTLCKNREK